MRVLLLSQFHAPVIGGEERHVTSLGEALAERGHEVAVATQRHPRRPDDHVEGGVAIHGLRGTMQRSAALFSDDERRHAPPFPDPELTLNLARLVREFRPDVVHAHNWLLHSYLPLRQFNDAAFVVTLHDYGLVCARKTLMRGPEPCPGPSPMRCFPCASQHYGKAVGSLTYAANTVSSRIERRLADRFIAVSRAVAEKCGLPGGRTPYEILPTFIPDAVGDLDPSPDPRVALLPDDGYLLYVGDLNRNKGVSVLLKAYASLGDAPPLVMIGRRCADMPDELPPNVTVFESWPHAAVMHAWSRCLFGIAPSVWPEACGTIVMEAHAVGRPMIASDIGGLSDLVDPGKTGLLVPAGDDVALADAMSTMIQDPTRRETMALACRARAELFMAKTIVPRIERIYDELVPRPTPRAECQLSPVGT
ncbi:glycosyltransferase family 4 protein [Methylobacterium sp. E-016]|uniref:glycosyltransferase family 4 protein n=1 Tax=Methylobacterium sp. E-016 TaxID=2836556 RepID=UPI001FBA3D1D|nr:glycosyltransferase family 4 protein [Methylobacterium sp. E-016]MCJ2076359.1 glycosyltransferase family 4 protein [Methylobacterium sp. E-016]